MIVCLAVITVAASSESGLRPALSGSGGIRSAVTPSLTVVVTTSHGTIATYEGSLVVVATVSSSSIPVSGATVFFSDTAGSTFLPSAVATNATGTAITSVHFTAAGVSDTITGLANDTGYTNGTGTAVVTIEPNSASQLTVSLALEAVTSSGESTDVVSGEVFGAGSAGDPIADSTITFSDSAGSTFSSPSVLSATGYFEMNFTLPPNPTQPVEIADFVTASASASGYSTGLSTTLLTITERGSANLTVTFHAVTPVGTPLAIYDDAVMEAVVTAGGAPVSGASVTFSDTFGSKFTPVTAVTDASGNLLTDLDLTTGNAGTDYVSASASLTGYSSDTGWTFVTVLGLPSTQLSITEELGNIAPTGGSTDVVYGSVLAGGTALAGASVTLSDTLGSKFSTLSTTTDANGQYAVPFAVPPETSASVDFLTVNAAASGDTSSSSGLYLSIVPYGATVLTVTLAPVLPTPITAPGDSAVFVATVTAGGTPIGGADVSFLDTYGSSFTPTVAVTNASGVAFATAVFPNYVGAGMDIVTATGALTSYLSGTANAADQMLSYGSTQLGVSQTLTYQSLSGGSEETLTGTVYYQYSYYCGIFCGTAYATAQVAGATVTFSDTVGSTFQTGSLLSGAAGAYTVNFTLPSHPSSRWDAVEVSAALSGYTGTSSASGLAISPLTSTVVFRETGLPTGSSWSVNLAGTAETSRGTGISFEQGNGTYDYSASAPAGYFSSHSQGSVTVSGTGVVVDLAWSTATSPITFNEAGLPASTEWSVTLNGTLVSSTNTSIVFNETTATGLLFTVSPIPGYVASPSSGSLNVTGVPASISIKWTETTYTATFVETGLPAVTAWSVMLATAVTGAASGSSITFTEANGSYAYTVSTMAGYVSNPSSGTLVVNGANKTVPVSFTPSHATFYPVTFTENGLPSGDTWSVSMNGVENSSSGSSIGFSVGNGNYTFSVAGPTGSVPDPTGGKVVVLGGSQSVSVSFAAPPAPKTIYSNGTSTSGGLFGLPTTEAYGLVVGLLAVVAVVAAVVGLRLGRGSKREGVVAYTPPAGPAEPPKNPPPP